MAKRFIDTSLYKHSWYRKLNPKMKCVWIYLTTNCDHAGIYDVDLELMSFMIGSKITEKEIFTALGNHIAILKNGSEKWYLRKFVKFQYGELKDTNNAHKSVIKQLNKYDIDLGADEGLVSISSAYKDKDKDMVKIKVKDKSLDKKSEIFSRDVCAVGIKESPMIDPDTITAFIEYWTEPNKSKTKMRYEMQTTWDTKRRLLRWANNNFNKPQKDKKKLTDYNKDTTGFPMGYCAKCGDSASYKDFEILNGDSRCCNAEILPKRKVSA